MSGTVLYTIILQYKGGTYISQVSAQSPLAALKKWAKKLNDRELANWKLFRAELSELLDDDPVPLQGLLNAWCTSGCAKFGLMLVNIVATRARKT